MRTVANLTVHGIGPAGRRLDPGEDRTWIDVAVFDAVLEAIAARRDVYLTFDDGNLSDLRVALPRLVAHGVVAEFFVLAGRLGEPGRLDAAGVRELAAAGMQIGSHGWAHRDWRRLAPDEVGPEIHDAPRLLEDLVGAPVDRVAVPFGSYDRIVLRRLRAAGTRRVFTSDGGRARPGRWLQRRTSLHAGLAPRDVAGLLAPQRSPHRLARRAAAVSIKRLRGAPDG